MRPALLLLSLLMSTASHAQSCTASSGTTATTVVELYTSEGCSSCPPADRWLSTLKGKPDVLALAFHVTYWDKLGWPDRFASREATARQYELASLAGSRQVYTPQVVASGQDWRAWPQLPAARAAAGPVLRLVREGDKVALTVDPFSPSAGAALQGYWAVLEDQHSTRVRAGENAGETLRHDHVVRLYKPLAAWPASQGLKSELSVSRGVPEHPRRVAFVVTDAAQRPLQAVVLAC